MTIVVLECPACGNEGKVDTAGREGELDAHENFVDYGRPKIGKGDSVVACAKCKAGIRVRNNYRPRRIAGTWKVLGVRGELIHHRQMQTVREAHAEQKFFDEQKARQRAERHRQNTSNPNKTVTCPVCRRRFASEAARDDHIASKHSGPAW